MEVPFLFVSFFYSLASVGSTQYSGCVVGMVLWLPFECYYYSIIILWLVCNTHCTPCSVKCFENIISCLAVRI